MKKTILFMLASVAIVMSSCLGDSENTYTGGSDFAVIKRSDGGVLYASVLVSGNQGLSLTWDGIDQYAVDDAILFRSYKTDYNTSGDSFIAESYSVAESFPVSSQKTVTQATADTLSNVNDKIGFTSIAVTAHSGWASIINDRWLISYVYNQLDGEAYNINFVYDETKQILKSGVTLPDNTAVVDVIFTKTREATGTSTEKKSDYLVVNFSTLRSLVKPTTVTSAAVPVAIYFRYSKEGTNSVYANYSSNVGNLYYSK